MSSGVHAPGGAPPVSTLQSVQPCALGLCPKRFVPLLCYEERFRKRSESDFKTN